MSSPNEAYDPNKLGWGFAAAIIVAGAEFAGELMTNSIGLSGMAILDPVNNTQGAILGTFMQMLAVTLLLTGGGHLIMLQAVAQSFVSMPLGAPLDLEPRFPIVAARNPAAVDTLRALPVVRAVAG